MATIEDRIFKLDVDKEYYCRDVFSRWMDLAYNTIETIYQS